MLFTLPGEQLVYVMRCFASITTVQQKQAVQQAGFLVVDLYRWVLLQVEIAYCGQVGDVVCLCDDYCNSLDDDINQFLKSKWACTE